VDPHEPSEQPAPGPDLQGGRESTRTVSAPAVIIALVLGAVIGGMAVEYWLTRSAARPEAQAPAASATLTADVEHLKSIVPTQSHTMTDVGLHWANLWFAVQKKNWPLANYFFHEARQAMRWTVVIRPVRQKAGGGTVDVKGIFNAMDISAFATVQLAVEDQNEAEFVGAYKSALEACHSCHVASELPFIRPTIPTAPPTTLIDFNPTK
jgi:hypothetical protein